MKNYDTTIREMKTLSKVDSHTNLLVIITMQKMGYFYIALEKCDCPLRDFIFIQRKIMFEQKKLQDETKNVEERKKFSVLKKLVNVIIYKCLTRRGSL